MHVLVFSWFFPPYLSAGASRVGQLTKHLVRSGVRVSVVSGRPNDLPAMSDLETGAEVHYAGNVDLNALPRMVLGRRDVVEHGYALSRLGRFRGLGLAYKQLVHLPDAQAGWILPAVRAAAALDRPDVVVSSSPPASAHLAAARFALSRGIPWVAEYRSPWTDSLYFRRWWPARSLERSLERWVGRRASVVTAISGSLQERLSRTLGRPVEHIPNGYDPEDFRGDVKPEPGLFVHLGTVYAPYPTQTLIEALRLVMYEYFAARRPIIAIGPTSSETADELWRSGIASFAEDAAGLARYLDDVPDLMPDNDFIGRYAYERIAARFREILGSVM